MHPNLAEELLHPRGETTSPTLFGNFLAACQALCQDQVHFLSHLPVVDRAFEIWDESDSGGANRATLQSTRCSKIVYRSNATYLFDHLHS